MPVTPPAEKTKAQLEEAERLIMESVHPVTWNKPELIIAIAQVIATNRVANLLNCIAETLENNLPVNPC